MPDPVRRSKFAVGLVIGLVAGGSGGYLFARVTTPTYQEGHEAGYDLAHRKLLDSGLVPSERPEIRTLTGTVVSIGDSSFLMTSDYRLPDPLDTLTLPTERTVLVTENTEIITVPEEGEGDEPSTEPIALEDLTEGDIVTVTSTTDILSAERFEAMTVVQGRTFVPGNQGPTEDRLVDPLPPEEASGQANENPDPSAGPLIDLIPED